MRRAAVVWACVAAILASSSRARAQPEPAPSEPAPAAPVTIRTADDFGPASARMKELSDEARAMVPRIRELAEAASHGDQAALAELRRLDARATELDAEASAIADSAQAYADSVDAEAPAELIVLLGVLYPPLLIATGMVAVIAGAPGTRTMSVGARFISSGERADLAGVVGHVSMSGVLVGNIGPMAAVEGELGGHRDHGVMGMAGAELGVGAASRNFFLGAGMGVYYGGTVESRRWYPMSLRLGFRHRRLGLQLTGRAGWRSGGTVVDVDHGWPLGVEAYVVDAMVSWGRNRQLGLRVEDMDDLRTVSLVASYGMVAVRDIAHEWKRNVFDEVVDLKWQRVERQRRVLRLSFAPGISDVEGTHYTNGGNLELQLMPLTFAKQHGFEADARLVDYGHEADPSMSSKTSGFELSGGYALAGGGRARYGIALGGGVDKVRNDGGPFGYVRGSLGYWLTPWARVDGALTYRGRSGSNESRAAVTATVWRLAFGVEHGAFADDSIQRTLFSVGFDLLRNRRH